MIDLDVVTFVKRFQDRSCTIARSYPLVQNYMSIKWSHVTFFKNVKTEIFTEYG